MTGTVAKISLFLSAGALALALNACDKGGQTNAAGPMASADPYALPLTVGPADTGAPAPAADTLPAAPRPQIGRVRAPEDDYAYLDDAYWASDAFDDAPPDYGFGYDGVDAWAWRAPDGMELVEPLATGYRHYYYRPGSAYPYLISDPDYSYGYDGPELVVIYGSAGQVLPWTIAGPAVDYAGRYLVRAQDLYRAAQGPDRQPVSATSWGARQSQVAAQAARWNAERASQTQWQAYDQAHQAQQAAEWNNERQQRREAADRFSQWRQTNFQGPAPAPVRAQSQAVVAPANPPQRQAQANPVGPPAAQQPNRAEQARPRSEQQQLAADRAAQQQRQANLDRQNQAPQPKQAAQDHNRQVTQQKQAAAAQQAQQHEAQRQAAQKPPVPTPPPPPPQRADAAQRRQAAPHPRAQPVPAPQAVQQPDQAKKATEQAQAKQTQTNKAQAQKAAKQQQADKRKTQADARAAKEKDGKGQ